MTFFICGEKKGWEGKIVLNFKFLGGKKGDFRDLAGFLFR